MEFPEDFKQLLVKELFDESNDNRTVQEFRGYIQKVYGDQCIDAMIKGDDQIAIRKGNVIYLIDPNEDPIAAT